MVQRSHGTSRCDPPPLGKQQRTSPRPSPGSAGEREVVRGVITQVSPSAGQQSWREPFDYTFLSKQHKATGSVIGSPPSDGALGRSVRARPASRGWGRAVETQHRFGVATGRSWGAGAAEPQRPGWARGCAESLVWRPPGSFSSTGLFLTSCQ